MNSQVEASIGFALSSHVTFIVVRPVGVNTSDASRDYIHLYRGDREALSSSLDRIQRAASVILKAASVGG